ncbi:MAG: VOC family protein [Saprospiraceae bacterium]|nr:VOC family protein [Saprospiraceae bacterium]MCB9324403.1 VOC family protein [Lewinellaceae bacterium]
MNLNQITIPSTNLFKSVPFYQKLGLQMIVDSVPRYARFVCPDGTTTFSIHHSEKMASGGEGIQVYFECDDLEQEVNRLKAEGLEFEHDPVDQVWLWKEARLRDPDGHLLVLYHAGTNRVNPPWRVES